MIFRIVTIVCLLFFCIPSAMTEVTPVQKKSVVDAPAEIPLDQPHLDRTALYAWVETAVIKAISFSYPHYQMEMQAASKNFTKQGWENYIRELQELRTLDTIQILEQTVSASFVEKPLLMRKQVLNGRYNWELVMLMLVKYTNNETSRTEKWRLFLNVERVPKIENPDGLAITQWGYSVQ